MNHQGLSSRRDPNPLKKDANRSISAVQKSTDQFPKEPENNKASKISNFTKFHFENRKPPCGDRRHEIYDDIEFQEDFWQQVLKEAKASKQPILIDKTQELISELKQKKQAWILELPKCEFDFKTKSLLDWHQNLSKNICHLPVENTNRKWSSIDVIAKFYTELLDYLVNPKND